MDINHEEIITQLRKPFSSKDVEWKIQVTTQDKTRGMAVPYMNARAVQNRLDEVVGPFNWKNVYSLWHDNAQICGISIFNAERSEWVTKFDGAENSDIEPIKGGLSDSFKRAASAWGIGRYLYEMDGIWVEVENKGKSSVIKQNQLGKLDAEYNAAVKRICGTVAATKQQAAQSGKQTSAPAPRPASAQTPAPAPPAPAKTSTEQSSEGADDGYKVQSVKPSGQSGQVLELVGSNGNVVKAYLKNGDQAIAAGARLCEVQMERKNSSYGEYNLISGYQIAA